MISELQKQLQILYHFIEIYKKFVILCVSKDTSEEKVNSSHHKFEISCDKSVARVTCASDTFRLYRQEDNKSCT